MKSKSSSRQKPSAAKPASAASAVEQKLQAVTQRMRSNPSIVAGVIIVGYCLVRLVLEV